MLSWLAATSVLMPASGVKATLLCAEATLQPGMTFTVGIVYDIPQNWHIYWKNPGDTGMATEIEWQLPTEVTAGPLLWPTPKVLDTPSGVSYGYEGRVVLMSRMTVSNRLRPGAQLRIGAKTNWLECEEICLPGSANLSLPLPVGAASKRNDASKAILGEAWMYLPARTGAPTEAINGEDGLTLRFGMPQTDVADAYFFSEVPGVVAHSAKQTAHFHDNALLILMQRSEFAQSVPARLAGTLLVTARSGARTAYRIDALVKKTNSKENHETNH